MLRRGTTAFIVYCCSILILSVFVGVFVWKPLIDDYTNYRQTGCRLLDVAGPAVEHCVQMRCGIVANGPETCSPLSASSTQCVAVTVDYLDGIGTRRQGVLFSDPGQHNEDVVITNEANITLLNVCLQINLKCLTIYITNVLLNKFGKFSFKN